MGHCDGKNRGALWQTAPSFSIIGKARRTVAKSLWFSLGSNTICTKLKTVLKTIITIQYRLPMVSGMLGPVGNLYKVVYLFNWQLGRIDTDLLYLSQQTSV